MVEISRKHPEDSRKERNIVIGLIVSDEMCKQIAPVINPRHLQTDMAKIISEWCMEFYETYEVAPKQDIQAIFKSREDDLDPDLADYISNFLENLSEEYANAEEWNHQYWADQAVKYLQLRYYQEFSEELREALDQEDLDRAEELKEEYKPIQKNETEHADPFTFENIDRMSDSVGIDEIEQSERVVLRPAGALGWLMGDLEVQTLVGLLGREKVGKTFNLINLCMQKVKAGGDAAIFEMGDMSMDQLDMRLISYITNKAARKSRKGWYTRSILDCRFNQDGTCPLSDEEEILSLDSSNNEILDVNDIADHVPCIECKRDKFDKQYYRGSIWWEQAFCDVWSWGEAKRKSEEFFDFFGGRIRRVAWSGGTINDVERQMHKWYEQDGFWPGLTAIDYPDIMEPTNPNKEKRHQEDEKWRRMRLVSQKWNTCVLAPTQSDAKGYNKNTLDMSNFNEAKTKNAHVTHFFSYNKTQLEETAGVLRVAQLLLREDSMEVKNQVSLLQDLRIGRPQTASFVGSIPIF